MKKLTKADIEQFVSDIMSIALSLQWRDRTGL